MCNLFGNISDLRLSCPLTHPECWDAIEICTQEEYREIIKCRKAHCEVCERNPKNRPVEPLSSPERLELPRNPLQFEPPKPISETPVTPEEVERIAERMKICIGCEKANYTKVDPQPEAAAFIPRTLRLAFTRAEYIHGVQGLTCKDRPGYCALSRAMKGNECEKWNG